MLAFAQTLFKILIRILFAGFALAILIAVPKYGLSEPADSVVRRNAEKSKADVRMLDKTEADVIERLNETDVNLNELRKQMSASRSELDALEKMIDKNLSLSKELLHQVKLREGYVFKRMTALYKLNSLGRLSFLASAESLSDFFQRKRALERILSHDQKYLEQLAKHKADLQRTIDSLNVQKAAKMTLEDTYRQQIQATSVERSKRLELLSDIRNKKRTALAALELLEHSLNRKIGELKSASNVHHNNVNNVKNNDDSSSKRLPNMPVNGKIVSRFGEHRNGELNIMNFRSGIDIQADRGEPVEAVRDGKVLYANWFKGYGNLLIIDHGEGYYTLYAYLEELFKAAGDEVESGEVVATVGEAGPLARPALHFEVRHHGKPVDPMQWLKQG